MGAIDFIFWVLAGAAPLSAGAGLAVIALTPAEFRASRYLFILAGVLAWGAAFLWGITTEVAFPIRGAIGAVLTAVFSFATIEAVRWVSRREQASQETMLPANNATAYFSCGFGRWLDAETDKQALNISIMNFGMAEPIVSTGLGPTNPHNHSRPFSSVIPLKCEITFYGDKPLFNIDIPVRIALYEVVRAENRNYKGNLIKILDGMPIRINQISFPNNNKILAYIYSFDVDAYIGVVNPDKFEYSTQDNNNRVPGRFITPLDQMSLIGPSPTPK